VKTKQKQIKKLPVHHRVKHHAKKVFIPHKANAFRPHLIRLPALGALLVVAVLAQLVYSFTTTGQFSVLSKISDINTIELLSGTNTERQQAGLASLSLNDQLSQAAFLKAQDMFAHNYWAHTSPNGVEPWQWFADVNYNYSYAGENLAKNYPTARATVEAWMNSPSHRENILNGNYVDVGFAVVDGTLEGQQTTLVVALYGSPVTVAAVEAASPQAPETFAAAPTGTAAPQPVQYFANIFMSLSPVTIAILAALAVVAIVGVAAHHYRHKLPKTWKRSWRKHHGMYTFVGVLALGVLIIIATGGGQV
jgi:uncharacterized protein YkwD